MVLVQVVEGEAEESPAGEEFVVIPPALPLFRPPAVADAPVVADLHHVPPVPPEVEGLGVAVMKASAAGLPVVACDAGGISEVVADGKTGLLVPPDDADALHGAIAKLIDDERLRASLGAAGRKRMQNEFSVATMAEAHFALYESLIAE